jgi:hypothetical protein
MKSTTKLAAGMIMLGALGALGNVGCAAPSAPERAGASTQKLLAPRAIVRTGASPKTRSSLGVYEWRVYKSSSEFVLTGYDAHQKPVQGFALGFAGKQGAQKAALKVRVLDGKGFAGRYDFQHASSSGALSAKSKQFLVRAAADFTTVAKLAPTKGSLSRTSANGLRFLGEAAPAGCARNAGKFVAGSTLCAVGIATVETGLGAAGAAAGCYLAADSALDFLSSCYGGSGAGDPNAANTFCDPGGSGFCSSSDTASTTGSTTSGSTSSSSGDTGTSSGSGDTGTSSSSGDTGTSSSSGGAGKDGAGDAAGNNQAEDPSALTSANNDGTHETASAEQAGEQAQTASNETSCDSCQGSASNLDVNDSNGDVQLADNQGANTSSDPGGATSGDTAADTGGGSGGDVASAAFHRLLGLTGGR